MGFMAKIKRTIDRFKKTLSQYKWYGIAWLFWEVTKDRVAGWANTKIDKNAGEAMNSIYQFVGGISGYPVAWAIFAAIVVIILILIHAYWTESSKPDEKPKEPKESKSPDPKPATLEIIATPNVEPDKWLLYAVHYVAYDSWEFVEVQTDEFIYFTDAGVRALSDIRQKAFEGDLPIWGKLMRDGPLKLIPNTYWEHYELETFGFAKNTPKQFSSSKSLLTLSSSELNANLGKDEVIYKELRTSKFKVEELWPKKKLEPPRIAPDMDMAEAIQYATRYLFPDTGMNINMQKFPEANKLILEEILSGKLIVWGKRIKLVSTNPLEYKTYPIQEVLSENGWKDRMLVKNAGLKRGDKEPHTESMKEHGDNIQFTELMVNSKQVEKLWPVSEIPTQDKPTFKATREELDKLFKAVVIARTKASNYQSFENCEDTLKENFQFLQDNEVIFEGSIHKQAFRDFMQGVGIAIMTKKDTRDRNSYEHLLIEPAKKLEEALR